MRSTLRCWRVNTRSTVLALSTIAVSSASSCGGATTPTSAPEQTRVGVPTSQTQPTKPGLERQPAPAGLFFVGRVAQPNALVGRLAQWCNLPFDLNDALSLAGDGMEKWVHLEQPVDFALSLAPERDVDEEQDYARDPGWGLDAGVVPVDHPPEVNAIVSIAVSEPEVLLGAFEQAGKSVKAKDNGEFVIEIERDLRCSLGPALGASAQRLTCGVSEYDLDALGAFARTNLATQVMPPKAAYFELRVEPFRTRHGDDVRQMKAMLPEFLREVNIGSERFDRAVGRVARASVDEVLAWLDGVDTWNFSVDIARDRDVFVGESTLVFRKDNSYVSNMFRRTAAENTAAPALFWDLPQDVHGASFRAPTSLTEDDRAIASALSELLAGGLEHWGVASGVVDGWLQSLQRLLESRGTVVVANGTMAPPSASKKGQPMGLLGTYYLIGIEGDRGAYVQAWKSSVATFNDKRLRSELAKRLDEDLPQLPLIRYRKVPQTKTTPSVELFELTFKLPKSAASKTFELDKLSMHLAMTVVGERTWIGMGFSEAAALQQVRRVVSAGDYPKLGARRGLDPLHEHRLLHGSFGTIEAYAKLLSGLPLLKNSDSLADDITRAMPHRGTTPAIFEVTTSATGPSMTTRLEVPREVFADGSAFIVALAAASTSALLDVGANDEEGD